MYVALHWTSCPSICHACVGMSENVEGILLDASWLCVESAVSWLCASVLSWMAWYKLWIVAVLKLYSLLATLWAYLQTFYMYARQVWQDCLILCQGACRSENLENLWICKMHFQSLERPRFFPHPWKSLNFFSTHNRNCGLLYVVDWRTCQVSPISTSSCVTRVVGKISGK